MFAPQSGWCHHVWSHEIPGSFHPQTLGFSSSLRDCTSVDSQLKESGYLLSSLTSFLGLLWAPRLGSMASHLLPRYAPHAHTLELTTVIQDWLPTRTKTRQGQKESYRIPSAQYSASHAVGAQYITWNKWMNVIHLWEWPNHVTGIKAANMALNTRLCASGEQRNSPIAYQN